MKNLIFIDNDNQDRAREDVDYVKNNLELCAKIPSNIVDKIEIISDFRNLEKDDIYKLLFSKDNVICTYSMYTANHYGSLFQLTSLLRAASTNQIKDIIYVDGSGMLVEQLSRELRNDRKDTMHILNAIETNYIISFDLESTELACHRIRVDLKGYYETPFKQEKINLLDLIK